MDTKELNKLVRESENLTPLEKFEASILLDKAGRAIEVVRIEDKLDVLRDLYEEIQKSDDSYTRPRYLEVLGYAISRLALDKKKTEMMDSEYYPSFDPVIPKTLGGLLRSITKNLEVTDGEAVIKVPESYLDKHVKIMESDGMGYCARGAMEATEAYIDDSGDIQIWV